MNIQTVKYWERKGGIIGGWAVDRFKQLFNHADIALPVDQSFQGKPFSIAAILRQHEIDISQPFAMPVEQEEPKRVICGATNRKGTSCKAWSVIDKKRCRFHGGLSTGPKTQAGRDRIRNAQLKRWAKHKDNISSIQSATADSKTENYIHGV